MSSKLSIAHNKWIVKGRTASRYRKNDSILSNSVLSLFALCYCKCTICVLYYILHLSIYDRTHSCFPCMVRKTGNDHCRAMNTGLITLKSEGRHAMIDITIRVLCPWCKKSETHIERPADASLTVQCPNCTRFYRVHAASGTAEKAVAHRRVQRSSAKLMMRSKS